MPKIYTTESFNRKIHKNTRNIQSSPYQGFQKLYRWQKDCYDLKDYQIVNVNVPTASGKSVLMRAWAASEVAESGSKVIIAVPSQSLAIEFEDQKENSRRWQAGNKKIPEFEIIQPLYDPEYCNSITRRIETLRQFLKSDASGVMVACYQTVVGAFHRLPKKHFSNMCLIVDEAHHSVIMDNDSVFESDLNSLGSVIQKCYQNNVVLRFLTATFFRDDRRGVISDSIMEEAVTYDMKLHDFLSDKQLCPQIKRIACDVRFSKSDSSKYQGGYYHSVKGIWEEDPSQKTAIWISNSSKYDKVRLTEEAIRALGTPIVSEATLLKYGIPQEELDEAYGSFIYVKDSFGNIHRVVELAIQDGDEYSDNLWKWYRGCVVTRTDRETVFNKYKESIISACVYLNKGQEGTNWKKLSRAIIYDQRKLGKSTQIIGRILRPSPKKSDVSIHYVLPQILCKTLNEDTKEIINNYINCLWASMIIGDYLEPLLVRAKREGYSSNSRLVRDQTEYSKVFAIDKEAERIYIRNCSERLDQWNEGLEYKPSNSETKEKLSEIVADEVSFGGLDVENHEKFVDATWQKLVMIKLSLGRTNPRKIEYNMIMNEDTPIGCSKAFYGTVMTKEFALEYKQFLDELRGVATKSLEEVKEYINNLSEVKTVGDWFKHWEYHKPDGISQQCWKPFGMTLSDFSLLVNWQTHKINTTKEENKNFWLGKDFKSMADFNRFCRHNTEFMKENGFAACPWKTFFGEVSTSSWMDYVFDREEKKTEMEHVEIIKTNNLFRKVDWTRFWKEKGQELTKQGYVQTIFRLSGHQSFDKWIRSHLGNQRKTKEETKSLWMKLSITKNKDWTDKYWTENKVWLKKEGYPHSPWSVYNMTSVEWLSYVLEEEIKRKTLEETKQFCLDNKLTSKRLYFLKQKEKPDLFNSKNGYFTNPWNQFNQFNKSVSAFFDYILDRK